MTNSELREKLEQLHAEIERTPSVDEETRRTLQHLIADVRRLIDAPREDVSAQQSPGRRLRESLLKFEVAHPRLLLNVEQVLDALNEMGI